MRKELAAITLLTAASQVSAFFKLWFTARVFGIGSDLDGYNLALVMPTLVSGVVAGFLQTGLFPVRAKIRAQRGQADVDAFERALLWIIAGLGCLFAAILSLVSFTVGSRLAGEAPASVLSAMRAASPILAALVALNMIGDCAGYVLAMRKRFAIAAAAPIANGLIGGLVLALWPEGKLTSLVIGTLLGLAVQVIICIGGIVKTGLQLSGPFPPFERMRLLAKEMSVLGVWILPGVVVSNLAVSLPPFWVATFSEGANSAFGYAYRLHSSTVQLFVMASSSVILANFSDLVATDQTGAVRSILAKSAIASALIGIFGVVLVGAIGAPLLELIFGGRFDTQAAVRVADHWWWMTTGVAFLILSNIFAKLWQSQQRPRLISLMAVVGLFALVATYLLLKGHLHEYSVAAAMAASAAAIAFLGVPFLGVGTITFMRKD